MIVTKVWREKLLTYENLNNRNLNWVVNKLYDKTLPIGKLKGLIPNP